MSIFDKVADAVSSFANGSAVIADSMAKKKQQSPQYDFLWRVELPDLDSPSTSIIDSFISQIGGSANSIMASDVNHRVVNFDSPMFKLDTKQIPNKNSYWYTASNSDVGTISLTLHEMEDGSSLKYLTQWRDLIVNEDGTYNPPASYKKSIRFYRMSATKLDLHMYEYNGFFISEISPVSNSYDGNGITSYSVTLTGDEVKYDFMSGAEVRTKVIAKELEIMGKQWIKGNTKLSGSGLTNVLRTAGSLGNLVR